MDSTKSIPIERFIEVKHAMAPAYSEHGDLYFLCNITGTPQIWTQTSGAPWPRQITFFPDRVMSYSISSIGTFAIDADVGGTENAQIFLADSHGLNLKNIANDPSHMYRFGRFAPDGRRFSYSSNRRNGRDFDIYAYDVERDEHRLLVSSEHMNHAHTFTPDGRALVLSRSHTNLDNDLYLVDIDSGDLSHLTPHEGEAHYDDPVFSPDGRWLYFTTNVGSEFARAAALNLNDRSLHFFSDDKWDAEHLVLSHDGRMLAYARNEDGTSKLFIAPAEPESGSPVEIVGVPVGVIDHVAWHPSNTSLAISVNGPTAAVDVWQVAFPSGMAALATSADAASAQLCRLTYAGVSGLPEGVLMEPELIHYETFDGYDIPAYYFRPKDTKGPYSVLVYVHGGPESQSRNDFNPLLQYFVQRGYAVLVPNVRGSSGYGKTYIHLDDVRKRMDSVADLAAAVEWLKAAGSADATKISVMGRSYGGFMALAAVTHYPKLWAAGIDLVGIANFRTFMENTSPYRRYLREAEYGTVEDDGEFFDAIAPIHKVNDIRCPMFISHGANDPRVPIAEAEGIVAALRARNHPVAYVRLEDEGHGIVKLKNRIHVYGEIARFLDEHVGTSLT